MEDIDHELINLLCTEVGMLMEDHSAQALTVGSQSIDEREKVLDELSSAVAKIEVLIVAAKSISE